MSEAAFEAIDMATDENVSTTEGTQTGFNMTGEQLATQMTSNSFPTQRTYQVTGVSESVMEEAKKCPWFMVRSFFDDEISKYTAAAQAAMTSKDWSSLKEIKLSVTMNENNNKYCCWECGGAKSTFGHSVIIGAPDGRKPLAMSAFRRSKIKNDKQAVIQIWPSYIVAIGVQNRGIGVVLLYRVAEFTVTDSVFVSQNADANAAGESHNHFAITLQLNKVINISTHEVIQFMNDLNHITPNSDIVKAAIRKATIFNCDQAIYVRPFFYKKDGEYEWNINDVDVEDTIVEESAVNAFFAEALAKFSNMVRSMPRGVFPYMGLQILSVSEGEAIPDQQYNSEVMVKFAFLTDRKSSAYMLKINRNVFRQNRDFFPMKGFGTLVAIAKNENNAESPKTFYCKYSGN